MPNIQISVPFQLTQEEALNRIKKMLSEIKQEHGDQIQNLQENWNGNIGEFSFQVKGFTISGELMIKASSVELSGDIPFLALPFKDKIEERIIKKAEEILS